MQDYLGTRTVLYVHAIRLGLGLGLLGHSGTLVRLKASGRAIELGLRETCAEIQKSGNTRATKWARAQRAHEDRAAWNRGTRRDQGAE